MLSRSVGSVDRPFIGRSAAAALGLLVALIAALAIGAANARASEDAQVADQSSETTQSATATAAPAEIATPVAPAEQEFDPAAQTSVEPVAPPAEIEATETETSTVPPPAEGPAEQPLIGGLSVSHHRGIGFKQDVDGRHRVRLLSRRRVRSHE